MFVRQYLVRLRGKEISLESKSVSEARRIFVSLIVLLSIGFSPGAIAIDQEFYKGWNMSSHDPRRTGRAVVNGARKGNKVWEHVANDGHAINMEPTVTKSGVFFGSWGVVRGFGKRKRNWDKFDGKIHGLDRLTGRSLWSPLKLDETKFAYRYKGRPTTEKDAPAGVGYHLNGYNGTVEGSAAVDPLNGNLYFGRGDGKLYAVDPKKGAVIWKFKSHDPVRPDDPEGGGEIVGGPLVTEDGLIIFGTSAGPPNKHRAPTTVRSETNALYAVNRDGKLVWRYPATGSLGNPITAPPALSPDGSRVYAATALIDEREGGELIAVERATGKLIWRIHNRKFGAQDIAVGSEGTLYVAGMALRGMLAASFLPVAFAVQDQGETGKLLWGPVLVDGERPRSHFAGGIALFESEGKVKDVYVSTTILRYSNSPGGSLHRINPANGSILRTWHPTEASPSCIGGLTDVSLDKEGIIYVGVRGQKKGFTAPETAGRIYALRPLDDRFEVLWSISVEGNLDRASPAIGPEGGIYFGSTSRYTPGHVFSTYINATPQDEDIPDADPIFYGVMDSAN